MNIRTQTERNRSETPVFVSTTCERTPQLRTFRFFQGFLPVCQSRAFFSLCEDFFSVTLEALRPYRFQRIACRRRMLPIMGTHANLPKPKTRGSGAKRAVKAAAKTALVGSNGVKLYRAFGHKKPPENMDFPGVLSFCAVNPRPFSAWRTAARDGRL